MAVHGFVTGDIVAQDRVELGQGARLDGNITCRILVAAEGAVFCGRTMVAESLRMFDELGDVWGIAEALERQSAVYAARGDPFRATRLLGAAAAVRGAITLQPMTEDRAMIDRFLERAQKDLGEAAWRAACDEGRRMSLDEAIDEATREMSR